MRRPASRRGSPRSILRASIVAIILPMAACTPAESPSEAAGASVSASQSASAVASVTAEPSASETAQLPEGWTQVHDVDAAPDQAAAREVVAGNGGYLAFTWDWASAEGGPHQTSHAFWHSEDGQTWSASTSPYETETETFQALTTTRDGDFLVFTTFFPDDDPTGELRARRSSDGEVWEEVETGLPDQFAILSIDHGPDASLLVGAISGPDLYDPGAWLSDDGITWERVLDLNEPGRFFNGGDGGAGDEGFVVVGTSVTEDSTSHEYIAYASGDGHEWVATRSPFGPEDPDFRPDPFVAALGPDWVAAKAMSPDDTTQFWFSDDGIAWEEAGVVESPEPLSQFDPVFEAQDGNLYFSTNGGGIGPGTPGLWTSPNGFDWTDVDLGTDAYLGGMATGDGFLLMTATTKTGDEPSRAGIWISPTD